MNIFQLLFVPLCAIGALWSVLAWRRGRTNALGGLFWASVWTAGALVIAVPDITSPLAHLFGITRGSDVIIYLAILAGLAACRYFYNRYRRLENVITDLVRAEALKMARQSSDSAPPISRNCQST